MRLLAVLLFCIAPGLAAAAPGQSTPARAAVLIDMNSGAVLLEKNADEPLPPASMSKLMTLYMVFDAMKTGRLSMSDEFRTSGKAASMGGSKMFIREGEVVSIEDLVRGVIVQSGNDAAVALAEALSGTEEAFAGFMNQRAEQIGLTTSHFANATGWPHPEQFMSTRDLATLTIRLIEDFPDLYGMFAETEFTWDDIRQRNRNPLLGLGIGADGLKTGHTEEAGYGLAASAKRGDRRVVLVVTGLDDAAQRKQESERLINWAFRAFENRTLYRAGEVLAEADVWIGERDRVALAPARDVAVTVPLGSLDAVELAVAYRGPIEAPIAAGTELGHVAISVPSFTPVTVPLVATEDVARGGFLSRMQAAAHLVLERVLPGDD